MLQLKNIIKNYEAGTETVSALKGIDLEFRKSEFVAILGPSGCGKTTLLNIIGGLDQYTDGDLLINNKSTKDFKDRDWDTYRNHSVGFVFQTYNLIPHQSVLSNVELALTLSGVSKKERRKRAKEALERVGLGDQLKKRPNQMSGGQMQRVAIARAIVNDPEILLADEPTGALDSETSVQVMEILKEISKDRLIIMVTHNPELAEAYANRIVRLKDGLVIDDSNPPTKETNVMNPWRKVGLVKKLPAMSFFTALSLSLNNLMTKKGRTILTAFAGSIGIIGIALILSLSTGIQNYINQVQEETLSSYPITIQAETTDMSSLMTSLMGVREERKEELNSHEEGRVYSSTVMYDMINSMMSAEVQTNNLRAFKKYLDEGGGGISDLATIRYGYNLSFDVYTEDKDNNILKSDVVDMMQKAMGTMFGGDYSSYFSTFGSMYTGFDVWEELLPGDDDELISEQVKNQYDIVYGKWPTKSDEIVLFISPNNEVSDLMLYALGYISESEMDSFLKNMMSMDEVEGETQSWSYSELAETKFKLILPAEYYQLDGATGSYTDMSSTSTGMNYLFNSKDVGVELKIVGIARPNEDATSTMVRGAIGYTAKLTEEVIRRTENMEIVQKQIKNDAVDVILNLPFKTGDEIEPTTEEKITAITDEILSYSTQDMAAAYLDVMSQPTEEYVSAIVNQQMANVDRASIEAMIVQQYAQEMGVDEETVKSYIADMDDDTLFGLVREAMGEQIKEQYIAGVKRQMSTMTITQLSQAMQMTLNHAPMMQPFTDVQYLYLYDNYMPATLSDSNYDKVMKKLGYVDYDDPASISIYATTFADKDHIADLIQEYNDKVEEEDEISYTDYVALLMSSITKVINAISYVLIAFVTISLIVSSIMIAIITYISVLERTKEIGILRSIGASKKDVSNVFNAETIIEGFISGAMGIIVSELLIIPINIIVHHLTDIENLSAYLPPLAAVALILISILLTFIAGLIPSRMAAKKDPVVALRTE